MSYPFHHSQQQPQELAQRFSPDREPVADEPHEIY
jgi:hypothetical protein